LPGNFCQRHEARFRADDRSFSSALIRWRFRDCSWAYLCADHFRLAQPRRCSADRRLSRDPPRGTRSGSGGRRHQLEYDSAAHRHDDPGYDLARLRCVSVSRYLVGAAGASRGLGRVQTENNTASLNQLREQLCARHIAGRSTDSRSGPLSPTLRRCRQLHPQVCKFGCEGIRVEAARLGSAYRSGRSRQWLKVKNPAAPAVRREAEEEWR
jgi:hypothetical protein